MLPVLGAERMAELLGKELEELGFIRDRETAKRTDPDGIEITVDLRAATVHSGRLLDVPEAAQCRGRDEVLCLWVAA